MPEALNSSGTTETLPSAASDSPPFLWDSDSLTLDRHDRLATDSKRPSAQQLRTHIPQLECSIQVMIGPSLSHSALNRILSPWVSPTSIDGSLMRKVMVMASM